MSQKVIEIVCEWSIVALSAIMRKSLAYQFVYIYCFHQIGYSFIVLLLIVLHDAETVKYFLEEIKELQFVRITYGIEKF